MEQHVNVHIAWDNEAHVWIGLSDDIPGLCLQADHLDEMMALIEHFSPEIYAYHAGTGYDVISIHIIASKTINIPMAQPDVVAVC